MARLELGSSDKAQVALHSDEFVRIVRLKCAFEVECLIAVVNHLLCLLLEHKVSAIVRVGWLEVATSCLLFWLFHSAHERSHVVLLVTIVQQRDLGLGHRV